MDFYFTGEVLVLTWAHPVAAVLDMGEKNGKYRHRVLFSSEKVWTDKIMDFTIQFIKMDTRAELKSVKSCPCRIGGDQAINALNTNGFYDQDNLEPEPEPPVTDSPPTETPQMPKIVKTMKSNIVVAIDTPSPFTRRVYSFSSELLCFILHNFFYFIISYQSYYMSHIRLDRELVFRDYLEETEKVIWMVQMDIVFSVLLWIKL